MNSSTSGVRFTLGKLNFTSASASQIITTIEHLLQQPREKRQGIVIGYINPHVFNLALEHNDVFEFLANCHYVCIDGLGIKLALKYKRFNTQNAKIHRVVALQLYDQLIDQSSPTRSSVLIGVEPDDVRQAMININSLNNRFTILDCTDGFQALEHYHEFLSHNHTVDWILIGAGTPKSEQIAAIARERCPHAIVFHMGAGSIKVYAGTKPRAASWISKCGFEWLHRVWFEPHTRERYTRGAWQFIKGVYHSKNNTHPLK